MKQYIQHIRDWYGTLDKAKLYKRLLVVSSFVLLFFSATAAILYVLNPHTAASPLLEGKGILNERTMITVGQIEPIEPFSRGILMDPEALAQAKKDMRLGIRPNRKAYKRLIRQANKALTEGPYSVMDKSLMPASGDKHDYLSIKAFYWPNPNTPDSLPFIKKKGIRNPEYLYASNDLGRFREMSTNVINLCLAYYFTHDTTYADYAYKLTRVWFLDEATRMNPNWEYAQSIPGKSDGRYFGIIDASRFIYLIDALQLIKDSDVWGEGEYDALKDWFSDFLDWMLTSEKGNKERRMYQSHGTLYDAQVVTYALFTERYDIATRVIKESVPQRLLLQIGMRGKQPFELSRSRSLHYSILNLEAYVILAKLAEYVDLDLWNYETVLGQAIPDMMKHLGPYSDPEKQWKNEQVITSARVELVPILYWAAKKYPDLAQREWLENLPCADWDGEQEMLIFNVY